MRLLATRKNSQHVGRVKRSVPAKPPSRSILPALALLVTTTATAGGLTLNSGIKQVTLLELYTSQGCSSCPPAERWLNEYMDDDDLWTRVVPMAFLQQYHSLLCGLDVYHALTSHVTYLEINEFRLTGNDLVSHELIHKPESIYENW